MVFGNGYPVPWVQYYTIVVDYVHLVMNQVAIDFVNGRPFAER